MRIATTPRAELREGDWREVLADVEGVDVLLADPPFSSRVHAGQRTGSSTRKATLHYDAITEEQVDAYVERWAPVTRWWSITFSDHLAARWWEAAWQRAGWYVFAPVLWIRENPTPRVSGDGPTSACDYMTIARPRHRMPRERMGHRPGYYRHRGNDGRENPHPGAKALEPLRAVVRDYTLPGDLVVDPFAGSATTLLAAAIEGREAIGAEVAPETFELAAARLRKGYTPDLFSTPAPDLRPPAEALAFDFAAEEAAPNE